MKSGHVTQHYSQDGTAGTKDNTHCTMEPNTKVDTQNQETPDVAQDQGHMARLDADPESRENSSTVEESSSETMQAVHELWQHSSKDLETIR